MIEQISDLIRSKWMAAAIALPILLATSLLLLQERGENGLISQFIGYWLIGFAFFVFLIGLGRVFVSYLGLESYGFSETWLAGFLVLACAFLSLALARSFLGGSSGTAVFLLAAPFLSGLCSLVFAVLLKMLKSLGIGVPFTGS